MPRACQMGADVPRLCRESLPYLTEEQHSEQAFPHIAKQPCVPRRTPKAGVVRSNPPGVPGKSAAQGHASPFQSFPVRRLWALHLTIVPCRLRSLARAIQSLPPMAELLWQLTKEGDRAMPTAIPTQQSHRCPVPGNRRAGRQAGAGSSPSETPTLHRELRITTATVR